MPHTQRIACIVQARMSSSRLPGKILMDIGGKPLLAHTLEALQACTTIGRLVVATSTEESDDPVAAFCEQNGVDCFRGPLEDVYGRFVGVIKRYSLDVFVRICGDSPLPDPELVDRCVKHLVHHEFDFVTNVLTRSFPAGRSVEVFRTKPFVRAGDGIVSAADREHVTSYFYARKDDYAHLNITADEDCSDVKLCVDTPEDMETMQAVICRLDEPSCSYSLEEILSIRDDVVAGDAR